MPNAGWLLYVFEEQRLQCFSPTHLFPPAAVSGSKQFKKSRSRVRADSSQRQAARPGQVQNLTQGRHIGMRRSGMARPSAVWPTASWTATESMLHQRRAQGAFAGARTAGGALCARRATRRLSSCSASAFHSPPTSQPSTHRVCAPHAASSG